MLERYISVIEETPLINDQFLSGVIGLHKKKIFATRLLLINELHERKSISMSLWTIRSNVREVRINLSTNKFLWCNGCCHDSQD